MDQTSFKYYVDRYLQGNITAEELALFRSLLNDGAHETELQAIMQTSWDEWEQNELAFPDVIERLEAAVQTSRESSVLAERPVHRMHFLRKWGWAAAAVIIIIGTTVAVFVSSKRQPMKSGPALSQKKSPDSNIAPGGDHALLTLADGRIIKLDSAANGQLANQGGVNIIKLADGQVSYDLRDLSSKEVMWNTMTTPRGGQYQLRLPDGTGVWLNAASSITYPATFVDNTREVTITGEVYFEVKANAGKPFIVKSKSQDITVLGTSFNVNAYEEESSMKTSLLEGSIKIGNTILQPGQAYQNGKIIQTDTGQDVAWKNGLFNFQDKKFDEVMRQLARWYDITVVYENGIPNKEYGGELKRNLSLSQILKILENSGVKFQLQGRKVTVKL